MVRAIANPRARALAALADRLGAMSHNAARQMHGEVNRIRLHAEALDRAAANRDPTKTPAAHEVEIAKAARQLDRQALACLQRCGEIFRAASLDVDARIAERANLKPDAFAAENRTAFRELDNAGRSKLVKELIDQGRGPELAAILKAPQLLTGLPADRLARYEEAFIAKHAAAELGERETIEAAFNEMCAASQAASLFVKELTDPNKLAEIERGVEAAKDASAALQSLQ